MIEKILRFILKRIICRILVITVLPLFCLQTQAAPFLGDNLKYKAFDSDLKSLLKVKMLSLGTGLITKENLNSFGNFSKNNFNSIAPDSRDDINAYHEVNTKFAFNNSIDSAPTVGPIRRSNSDNSLTEPQNTKFLSSYNSLDVAIKSLGATEALLIIDTNATLKDESVSIPSNITLKFAKDNLIEGTVGNLDEILTVKGNVRCPSGQQYVRVIT